jgi:hypothetical protein
VLTRLWLHHPWPGVRGAPPPILLAKIDWRPPRVLVSRSGAGAELKSRDRDCERERGLEVVTENAKHPWHRDPLQPFTALDPTPMAFLAAPHSLRLGKKDLLVIRFDK